MNVHDFVLDGVYPAAVTPFNERQEIDEEALERFIDHCVAGGVAGLVIAGTTGEYYALRDEERVRLFAAATKHVKGRVSLIAGCNGGSTSQVIDFGLAAKELAYDAILLSVPHTSLPSQRELAGHFETVARDVGLPIVLYNFPARSGVEISLETLEHLRDIPEIVAIKEASGDFSRFLMMHRVLGHDIAVSCGSDDQAFDYFTWGVKSWIAGTANVLPREHVEILAAVRRDDLELARTLHAALLPWIQDMESGQYNQKAKLGLRHVGIEVGEVRRPLEPLAPDEAERYRQVLSAAVDSARTASVDLASR
jgi:4-hydroxy-tetrahydrodipicolinate synthase